MRRDVGVVIVAGGAGIRAGGGVPKQYREIGGVPMVVRTVRRFSMHPRVRAVALVLPAADAATTPAWLVSLEADTAAGGVLLAVTAGGAERADSVAAGLAALPGDLPGVLVHDAARPFVAAAVIDGVIAAAAAGEAAIAAVPLADTLKAATADDPTRAVRTIPREHLWRAQTPQGFPAALLREAHARRAAAGWQVTDDAALVELLGQPVRLVEDTAANFKVTSADDLRLADLLARAEDL